MSERSQILWRWVGAALIVGAPTGAISALLAYALRESVVAEMSLSAGGTLDSQLGGPSVLLAMLWAAGGYVSAAVTDRHLTVGGLPAMGIVTGSAGVALVVGLGLYAILAGNLPPLLCALNVVCAVPWLGVGACRLYLP